MPETSSPKPQKKLDQLHQAIRIKLYSLPPKQRKPNGQSDTFFTSVTGQKWAQRRSMTSSVYTDILNLGPKAVCIPVNA